MSDTPLKTLYDPTWEASLIDESHVLAVVNIHIISVDLSMEYDKLTWHQMRDRNTVNRLTGKPYLDNFHLKRLWKILHQMEYSPFDITCYVPHDLRPFLFFPNNNSEILFSVAPMTGIEAQYALVPIGCVERNDKP
jgi:hypothetical protein